MGGPRLVERTLGEGSRVRVRFLTGPPSRHPDLAILVVRYAGVYGYGSDGNGDAIYMAAMAQAGVAAFEPWGVVHDLSDLAYEWGDRLDEVLAVGPAAADPVAGQLAGIFGGPRAASQPAVVVGPGCQEAVRTLLLGVDSDEPVGAVGYVFRDLPAAWAFVESQIV